MTMSYHLLDKSYKANNLVLGASIIILAIFIGLKVPAISEIISKIFYSALYSEIGGRFDVLAIMFSPVFGVIWLWLLFIKKDYLKALLLQIVAFPLTYKVKNAFAILAYDPGFGGTPQKISATTFLIIALFCILSFQGVIKKPKDREWRVFEKLILLYAISLTAVQFFNHSFHSAVWLSIGGIWQFILLFYMLSSLITSYDKIVLLLNSLIGFTFVNILMRCFSEEQVLFQQLMSGVIRVGAGAMGPAVSYGGYLAVMITIAFGLYRIKNNALYLVIAVFFFVELLNTFTRGAFLALFFLLLIPFWQGERKFIFRITIMLIPILLLSSETIWEFASYRGLSFGLEITKLTSVSSRIDLILNYFANHFNFSLIGNGIGNLTLAWGGHRLLPPHNILIALIDQTGIIVALLFMLSFSYACYVLFKNSKNITIYNKKTSILSTYLFIALIQWFFFANTTSTLLNWYYPYETSAIFWMVLFLSVIISKVNYADYRNMGTIIKNDSYA